ncbi:hypothetical protein COY27_04555 [Candidatus Woesearchaeota archaeon CG_4_10_14_0_2_um_filter_33_13]|nr:MAG: hypothetical protein COY27_04555 [Candidatus Woesearchaeota archaeon CG_4_10_14_0_2_um_filter_33_13]
MYRLGQAISTGVAVATAAVPAIAYAQSPPAHVRTIPAGDLARELGQDKLAEVCGLLDPVHKKEVCDPITKRTPRKVVGTTPKCDETYTTAERVGFCADPKIGPTLQSLGLEIIVHPGTDYSKKSEEWCPGAKQCVVVSKPTCPEPTTETRYVCTPGNEVVNAPTDCPPGTEPTQQYVCPNPEKTVVTDPKDCPALPSAEPVTKYVCPTGEEVDDKVNCPAEETRRVEVYGGVGGEWFSPSSPYVPLLFGIDVELISASGWFAGIYGGPGFSLGDSKFRTIEHEANLEATTAGGPLIGSQITEANTINPGTMGEVGLSTSYRFLQGNLWGEGLSHLGVRLNAAYIALMQEQAKSGTQRGWAQTQAGEIFQEGVPGPIDLPGNGSSTEYTHGLKMGVDLEGQLSLVGPWFLRLQTGPYWLHTFGPQADDHFAYRVLGVTGFGWGGSTEK